MKQWQRIDSLLQEVLDRPPHERSAFLNEACVGDTGLQREVTSLASAYDQAADFIEQPALTTDAEVLFTLSDDNIGRELASYMILERLGSGGMGDVYLAKDRRLDRLVAIKILTSYLADDTRLHRFRKEARAASSLNHPNILTIYEVGAVDGVRFIATEYIEGQTVRELIGNKDLSVETALDITIQVCVALAAAHEAGIIHRDVKPENVMRRPDGIVKLLDFGIAKLTESGFPNSGTLAPSHTQTEMGVVMGTVNYMSPEQARGLQVDARTDIWSLGVLLFEMLSYRLPFLGPTRLDTMVAILEREPSTVDVGVISQRLQAVISKALQKNADDRYQTASELLTVLQNLRDDLKNPDLHLVHTEPPQVPVYQPPKEVDAEVHKSKSRFVLLGVGVLLLALGIGGVFVYQRIWKTTATVAVVAPKNYSQMSLAEQFAFIEAQEQRISSLLGDRPAKLNLEQLGSIKTQIDRYVTRTNVPENSLPVVFARARPYLPTIARSFSERNVPLVIGIYLPMIESEYRPCLENEIGSKGLYQFMPQTAQLYGVSGDQMCDEENMTPAAAHYIADRIAELGDDSQSLTLVVLSYTIGPAWVRDTMRQLRAGGAYERNFWTVFANRNKVDERYQRVIVGYVPQFFAAAIIGENPSVFELPFEPLSDLAKESVSVN